jgi:hypothetical protein
MPGGRGFRDEVEKLRCCEGSSDRAAPGGIVVLAAELRDVADYLGD